MEDNHLSNRIPWVQSLGLNIIKMSSKESSKRRANNYGSLCLFLSGNFYYQSTSYSIVVSTKVILYLSSFFTSSLNDMLDLNAQKILFSLQSKDITIDYLLVWRLLTAPLATDGLFDCLIVLTFYMIKVISPMEIGRAHV